jgi:hypothetical protein
LLTPNLVSGPPEIRAVTGVDMDGGTRQPVIGATSRGSAMAVTDIATAGRDQGNSRPATPAAARNGTAR